MIESSCVIVGGWLVDPFQWCRSFQSKPIETRKCPSEDCSRSKVRLPCFRSERCVGDTKRWFNYCSSTNAKKWQEELEILRNNNAKLTTALQESHANVEEWKRQLQYYRDECTRLRQLVNMNEELACIEIDSSDNCLQVSHHSNSDGPGSESQELKHLLDNADHRNEEQEQVDEIDDRFSTGQRSSTIENLRIGK